MKTTIEEIVKKARRTSCTKAEVEQIVADAISKALASKLKEEEPSLKQISIKNGQGRGVMPFNTGMTHVKPGSTATITCRPQWGDFRPERIFVSSADVGEGDSAANWLIEDFTIGNRSQFAQSGAIPGDMFASNAVDSFVSFIVADRFIDVTMVVKYIGKTKGGTPFYGSVIGSH